MILGHGLNRLAHIITHHRTNDLELRHSDNIEGCRRVRIDEKCYPANLTDIRLGKQQYTKRTTEDSPP